MKDIKSEVTILGAGLAGLSLAYFLQQKNIPCTVLEARDRVGGRMLTIEHEGQAPQEMGATWLGKKHTTLTSLLQELGIGTFEQILGGHAIYEPISTSPPQLVTLPPNTDPSFRIQGGSSALIKALQNKLPADCIQLNQPVTHLSSNPGGLLLKTPAQEFLAKIVVSTLPPFLFTKSIVIEPELPTELLQLAQQTHTWMGESIKVALNYAEPFWRSEKSSGTIFSNVGPIPEMYDHSNVEESAFGLKGFLNGNYFPLTKEERLEIVLRQLEKYYGKKVYDFLSYEETVWRNEPFTFSDYDNHILPHQNNGDPLFRKPFLNGKLFLAGAETAASFPGYMDGAVESAAFVAAQINSSAPGTEGVGG